MSACCDRSTVVSIDRLDRGIPVSPFFREPTEPVSFSTITSPDPEDVSLTAGGDPHHDRERGMTNIPVTDFHMRIASTNITG